MRYVAMIHPPEGPSLWGVTFPDLPGCTSSGRSFEEASANAQEALSGHLAAMQADGDPLPRPRLLAEIMEDAETAEEAAGAFPVAVVAPDLPMEGITVEVTMRESLLRELDRRAVSNGMTRSQMIETALKEKIGQRA